MLPEEVCLPPLQTFALAVTTLETNLSLPCTDAHSSQPRQEELFLLSLKRLVLYRSFSSKLFYHLGKLARGAQANRRGLLQEDLCSLCWNAWVSPSLMRRGTTPLAQGAPEAPLFAVQLTTFNSFPQERKATCCSSLFGLKFSYP